MEGSIYYPKWDSSHGLDLGPDFDRQSLGKDSEFIGNKLLSGTFSVIILLTKSNHISFFCL